MHSPGSLILIFVIRKCKFTSYISFKSDSKAVCFSLKNPPSNVNTPADTHKHNESVRCDPNTTRLKVRVNLLPSGTDWHTDNKTRDEIKNSLSQKGVLKNYCFAFKLGGFALNLLRLNLNVGVKHRLVRRCSLKMPGGSSIFLQKNSSISIRVLQRKCRSQSRGSVYSLIHPLLRWINM